MFTQVFHVLIHVGPTLFVWHISPSTTHLTPTSSIHLFHPPLSPYFSSCLTHPRTFPYLLFLLRFFHSFGSPVSPSDDLIQSLSLLSSYPSRIRTTSLFPTFVILPRTIIITHLLFPYRNLNLPLHLPMLPLCCMIDVVSMSLPPLCGVLQRFLTVNDILV